MSVTSCSPESPLPGSAMGCAGLTLGTVRHCSSRRRCSSKGFNLKTEVRAERLRVRRCKALEFSHLQKVLRALRVSA
jgi:hypothetical protein